METKTKSRGKIKNAIVRVAPKLAHALGGPLAGAAVEHLSRAIFGAPMNDEALLSETIASASPEQWLALQIAEREFEVALREASVEEHRIDAGDRANARARHIEMKDRTPMLLGALIIGGFFIVLGVMISHSMPTGVETEFSIMLGALATMTAAVVNYFFGSSSGSKEKTWLMAFPAEDQSTADEE